MRKREDYDHIPSCAEGTKEQIALTGGPGVAYPALYERANALLLGALDVLDVSIEQWRSAGLPLSNQCSE